MGPLGVIPQWLYMAPWTSLNYTKFLILIVLRPYPNSNITEVELHQADLESYSHPRFFMSRNQHFLIVWRQSSHRVWMHTLPARSLADCPTLSPHHPSSSPTHSPPPTWPSGNGPAMNTHVLCLLDKIQSTPFKSPLCRYCQSDGDFWSIIIYNVTAGCVVAFDVDSVWRWLTLFLWLLLFRVIQLWLHVDLEQRRNLLTLVIRHGLKQQSNTCISLKTTRYVMLHVFFYGNDTEKCAHGQVAGFFCVFEVKARRVLNFVSHSASPSLYQLRYPACSHCFLYDVNWGLVEMVMKIVIHCHMS
jgi:hypothetical protein